MKTSLCIALLFVWCLPGFADEVVVPSAQATQAGNSSIIDPFRAPATIDEVYGAKNFSGPQMIAEVAFRLDQATGGGSYEVSIPRAVVRMSTFSGTYSSFTPTGGTTRARELTIPLFSMDHSTGRVQIYLGLLRIHLTSGFLYRCPLLMIHQKDNC